MFTCASKEFLPEEFEFVTVAILSIVRCRELYKRFQTVDVPPKTEGHRGEIKTNAQIVEFCTCEKQPAHRFTFLDLTRGTSASYEHGTWWRSKRHETWGYRSNFLPMRAKVQIQICPTGMASSQRSPWQSQGQSRACSSTEHILGLHVLSDSAIDTFAPTDSTSQSLPSNCVKLTPQLKQLATYPPTASPNLGQIWRTAPWMPHKRALGRFKHAWFVSLWQIGARVLYPSHLIKDYKVHIHNLHRANIFSAKTMRCFSEIWVRLPTARCCLIYESDMKFHGRRCVQYMVAQTHDSVLAYSD